MKKLFLFCLLASFTLATNSFAGPKKAVTFLGDPDCSGFNLNSCPAHATCETCKEHGWSVPGSEHSSSYITKYKMTGCESGYSRVGNKCMKKINRDATPTKVVPTTSVTRTVTTKRKK